MASLQDVISGSSAHVSTNFLSLSGTDYPLDNLAWFSISAPTGAITTLAAATATASAIFSLRNIGTNLLIIKRIGVGFVVTTGFTAAQRVEFGLRIARSFSGSDSGGTAIVITGNNLKHRTSLAAPTNIDCRIATTAVLTNGTKTMDTNFIGIAAAWNLAATAGTNIVPSLNNLLSHDIGDYPIVLANNEGINVENLVLMGAAGVGIAYVNLECAELSTF